MNKKISIIIPAYNAEKTIENCIKSIGNDKVEIIVIIDGCIDNTLNICNGLLKQISNLRIITQENKGVYEARKKGIENAQGEYLMFLDSDDMYEPNTIDKIQEVLYKYDNPDIIRFRYRKIPNGYDQYKYSDENEIKIEKKEYKDKVYPMFIENYMLNSLWTNCVKKELFKSVQFNDSNIKYGEDLLINYQLFSNSQNVVFINDILYNYVNNSISTTNNRNIETLLKHLQDSIYVYTLLHSYLLKWDMNNEENIKKVNERIKKEADVIINLIKDNI